MTPSYLNWIKFLVRRPPEEVAQALTVLMGYWLISPERFSLKSEFQGLPLQLGMDLAILELMEIKDPAEFEKILSHAVHFGVLEEHQHVAGEGETVESAEAPALPAWVGKERSEQKIRGRRTPQQEKVLLAVGILSGGREETDVTSGSVKRLLREFGEDGLATDATTFLTKLSEAGELTKLPERLSRREVVFRLTAEGCAAIDELLL